MNQKNNLSFGQFKLSLWSLTALILVAAAKISAQTPSKAAPPVEDYTWWYVVLAALGIGLAGAVAWSVKSRKQNEETASQIKAAEAEGVYDRNSLDAEKEMEWLRKNQKLVGKKEAQPTRKKNFDRNARNVAEPAKINENLQAITENIKEDKANSEPSPIFSPPDDSKNYLPIMAVRRLERARPFDDLPISNDNALMDAIEQTLDELEEDSEVRELAVRILAAFKTRNSVEALSQVALYDLLANLRSKAVTILCEFDHESVFEPILLACADPTREVRAAAARGLTKLTFDRSNAWTRISELDAQEGRVISAARAAVESGFVDMSFDRLVHQDHKHAYEAFALMTLLIKAGETEKIFNALENHRDVNVRRAVLHIIKVTKDQKTLEGLYNLLEKGDLSAALQQEVDRTIEEIGYATA